MSRARTDLADVEAELAANGQRLPFEPPSFGEADQGRVQEQAAPSRPSQQDPQPEQHGAPSGSPAPAPVAGDYEGYVTPLVRKLARDAAVRQSADHDRHAVGHGLQHHHGVGVLQHGMYK